MSEDLKINIKKNEHQKRRLRPTAAQVFFNIFFAVFSILVFRWIVFEMFLIPSGSMYPHLFERDYIVATKADFGLRIPFSQKWLIGPFTPERGEVVIFKSMDESKFFIKRVIGLPGDKIELEGDFVSSINGEKITLTQNSFEAHSLLAEYIGEGENRFSSFKEGIIGLDEPLTVLGSFNPKVGKKDYEVPPGHILVMGDNRHRSYDGRFFGYLPLDHLIGKARRIVFSCEKYSPGTSSCDMQTLRFDRIGKSIGN